MAAKADGRERGTPHLLASMCVTCWRVALRVSASLMILACLLAALLFVALQRGPVTLPGLADYAVTHFEEMNPLTALQIGELAISLDPETGRLLLLATEVELLEREEARRLLSVPRMAVRLSVPMLLQGGIEPTEVVITGPTARLIRTKEGLFRFDLGETQPLAAETGQEGLPAATPEGELTGFEVVNRVLDGMVGDAPPRPATALLRRLEIRDADFLFRNAATGAVVRTRGARFELTREPDRLTGIMRLPVISPAGERTFVTARGVRRRGVSAIELTASIRNLGLAGIARQLPEMAWLAPFEAPVSGTIAAMVEADGGIDDITANLRAGQGSVLIEGEPLLFDSISAQVAYQPRETRLRVKSLDIDSPVARTRLAGHVTFETEREGAITGLFADLHAGETTIVLPERFDAPIVLDALDASFRAGFSPLRLEIADVYAARGELRANATGSVAVGRDARHLSGGARIAATGMTVTDLKELWPAGTGGNARPWAREHLVSGRIPQMLAQVRFGAADPEVSLDFTFADVVADILDGMPPIVDGAGEAQVRIDDMVLGLSAGAVSPDGERQIDIAGSHVTIFDFDGAVTPADITVEATGATDAMLKLIDREPLRMVSKLGLPIENVAGATTLTAELGFPLIQDLLIRDIDVTVTAALRDAGMSLTLPDLPTLPVANGSLALTGTTEALSLEGDVDIAEAPFDVAWSEGFTAATTSRRFSLRGRVDPDLMARLGVEQSVVTGGSGEVVFALVEEGGAVPAATLDADLAQAELAIPGLSWSKPAGVPGRATLEAKLGDTAELRRIEVEGGGLALEGKAVFDAAGSLSALAFSRFVVGDQAEITMLATATEDALRIDLGGERLDVGLLSPGASEGTRGRPTEATIDLEQLIVVPEIVLLPALGRVVYSAEGAITAIFEGRVNGFAPIDGSVTLPADGLAGQVTIESRDAGAFLRATGIATTAQGGRLRIDARLEDGGLDTLSGVVRMSDIQVTEGSVFEQILRQADNEKLVLRSQDALRFSEVEMPFRYEKGIITLRDVVATGPALAVRLDGRVEPSSGRIAMRGVASPAYALSGFLNRIPVLGRILTGDRGEGLLALTFKVSGDLDDPDIAVNPLSILAPGILRRVFEGDVEELGASTDVAETPSKEKKTRPSIEEVQRLSGPD